LSIRNLFNYASIVSQDRYVIMTSAKPDGMASLAGIREGMAILRIDQKTIRSVDDFKTALRDESLEKGLLMLVRTQLGNRFVILKIQ
jgi:serine protease Do